MPLPAPNERLALWLMAIRPRTLVLIAAPMLVGAVYGVTMGTPQPPLGMVAAALAALLIQIATNLANDAHDGARGLDDPATRLGPPRVTGLGLMPAATVRRGALLASLGAALAGLVAAAAGGWPILAIGMVSLPLAWAYSAGPRPISASPFGEVFVIAFFGLAASMGMGWLAGRIADGPLLLLGIAMGLTAAAVLTVNNHRDRAGDARNGRRTLAIVLGPAATLRLYAAELGGAALIAALALWWVRGAAGLAPLVLLPGAVHLARRLVATPIGPALNACLGATLAYVVALALVVSAVLILEHVSL